MEGWVRGLLHARVPNETRKYPGLPPARLSGLAT